MIDNASISVFISKDYIKAGLSSQLTIPCGQNQKDKIKVLTKDDVIIYFDGVFLENKSMFSLDNQGNLVLSSVVTEDAGLYKCFGESTMYSAINVTGLSFAFTFFE